MVKKLRWPPAGLGIGTPLNSALTSASDRARFSRSAWVYIAIGVATAAAILALDRLLFAGASLPHIRALRTQSIPMRLVIVLYSAVAEELIYRLISCTLVAWIALLALARVTSTPKRAAEWIGIGASTILFGLAHVANIPNLAHPFIRALTLNGVAGVVLGWLYWKRGIESALITHLAGDCLIYLVVANFI